MRIFVFLLFLNFLLYSDIRSQELPEKELRAVWIATVLNLDWPSANQNSENQKQAFLNMIDSLKKININAVIFQVRTECDAFYNSKYEPWSRYLTGVQGVNPGYDPLEFAITECHKRGMEIHAWLNPYRINVSTTDGGNYYAQENIYTEHPEWALIYSNGKKILNPGLPAVQKYIKHIAGDIINKYDVDGIHFDDYFYSYDGTPSSLDNATFQTYGSNYSNIGDFRRGSINKMIKEVYDTIQAIKPFLRFGVSPFGIYGNNMNPPGITGFDAYNGIYCDPLAWLNEGTVDYLVPQLYWPTDGSQDFGKLLPWWADKVVLKNRHVYAGHGIYRLTDNSPESFFDFSAIFSQFNDIINLSGLESISAAGWSLEEIVRQINIVRQNSGKGALGSVYFRAKDFERVKNLKKYIFDNSYSHKSVLPEITWRNSPKPGKVSNLRLEKDSGSGNLCFAWNNNEDEDRYAIYVITDIQDTASFFKSKNLLDLSFNKKYFPDDNVVFDNIHIGVVSYNRYWKAGDASELIKVDKPGTPVLISPADKSFAWAGDMLVWSDPGSAAAYYLQISADPGFQLNTREFKSKNTGFNLDELDLEGGNEYYWRVKAVNIGGYSPYSPGRSFITAFPATPSILSPPDNAENIELYPEFAFSYSDNTEKIHIQISKSEYSFDIYNVVDTLIDVQSKYRITKKLDQATEYFVRIKAKGPGGESKWSKTNSFRTYIPLPGVTDIFSPQNNSILNEELEYVQISWFPADKAEKYLLQISNDADFNNIIKEEYVNNATNTLYYNPLTKVWLFSRVAGINEGGMGPWSSTVRFILDNNYISSKDENEETEIIIFPNPCFDYLYAEVRRTNNRGKLILEFFNSIGQKIIKEELKYTPEQRIFKFDTKQMVCQPCYLRISDNKKTQTLKFVKK